MRVPPATIPLLAAVTAVASCHLAGGLGDLEFTRDGEGGSTSTTTSTGSGGSAGSGGAAGSTATGTGQGGTGGGGGAGGGEPCALSTFTDDFGGSSLDSGKWSTSASTGYNIGVESGIVFIEPAPDAINATNGHVESIDSFDLTDCAVWIEVLSGPAPGLYTEVQFDFRVDGDNEAEIEIEYGTDIHFDIEEGGAHLVEGYVTYDPTEHRWFRIRETSGTLYLETAPDGVSWTERLSYATPSWVTNGNVRFRLTVDPTTTAVARAELDNFNLAP
ncbi:MAG: hypothetical protein JRI23_11130 [Deltaproteobacteria bacterium]|jgi:hypothetical protein|nr:hypothetical protein [Deltaproteobacteria bacterium]MBW2532235.1 hypothetical protein [Deltaproteobacteria bacterium]